MNQANTGSVLPSLQVQPVGNYDNLEQAVQSVSTTVLTKVSLSSDELEALLQTTLIKHRNSMVFDTVKDNMLKDMKDLSGKITTAIFERPEDIAVLGLLLAEAVKFLQLCEKNNLVEIRQCLQKRFTFVINNPFSK